MGEIKKDRVGEVNFNNQGLKMWIIEYRKEKDIDIKFEDGFVAYNKRYKDFKSGSIQNKNFKRYKPKGIGVINRTGEINYNNQGLKMWIKNYRGCNDIDVEFEDGFISYNTEYRYFKNGKIPNRNFKISRPTGIGLVNRIGEINYNNYGSKMTIVEYINNSNITVEFENGWKTKATYNQFNNHEIKSPYDKSVFNIGYLGEGKYKAVIDGKHTKEYSIWRGMLQRCYTEKEGCNSYRECSVCDEWLNFQNFARWYKENYYRVDNQTMHIDKDILHKGNKIYSPENCIIVPERINILFVRNKYKRGKYPIGVHYDERYDTFVAGYNVFKSSVHLGWFNNPIEAFNVYKIHKEKYIKEVAEQYKDKIPEKLYIAMINYKVEITD